LRPGAGCREPKGRKAGEANRARIIGKVSGGKTLSKTDSKGMKGVLNLTGEEYVSLTTNHGSQGHSTHKYISASVIPYFSKETNPHSTKEEKGAEEDCGRKQRIECPA